jgi:hypothetical protein
VAGGATSGKISVVTPFGAAYSTGDLFMPPRLTPRTTCRSRLV